MHKLELETADGAPLGTTELKRPGLRQSVVSTT
jgi:hypothetical protein